MKSLNGVFESQIMLCVQSPDSITLLVGVERSVLGRGSGLRSESFCGSKMIWSSQLDSKTRSKERSFKDKGSEDEVSSWPCNYSAVRCVHSYPVSEAAHLESYTKFLIDIT